MKVSQPPTHPSKTDVPTPDGRPGRLPLPREPVEAAPPLSFLWLNRLADGKLAALDGDPDLGKSLVALDLCARLSRGLPFPDGAPCPGPANSIVLNAEDGQEDTISPRLEALGADLDRVFVLRQGDGAAAPLRIPSQLDLLAKLVAQAKARLVVLDPIMAFFDSSVAVASDQSVRRALDPLARLAEKYRCVILLIRHITKTGLTRALYRGLCSIGIIGACRSGWLIARDPLRPNRCVLAQVKNNVAPPQPSLAYELLPRDGGPPALSWVGTCELSADQLLAPGGRLPTPTPRDRARDFLAAFLEAGPRTSRAVWAEANKLGLSEHTLRRAKDELEARSQRVWADGLRLSYWLLPDQRLPEAVAPAGAEDDLEPWLAPLRERFPSPTPLDDL
jgi:hypothetical protein